MLLVDNVILKTFVNSLEIEPIILSLRHSLGVAHGVQQYRLVDYGVESQCYSLS